MGNICRSLCEPRDVQIDPDVNTQLDGCIIPRKEKDFSLSILQSKANFSPYLDLKSFAFFFGITHRNQERLHQRWAGVVLVNRNSDLFRERINEPIFPDEKYLIRKGVPLDQTKSYIQTLFGITNLKTEIQYNMSLKQVQDNLAQLVAEPPTFGENLAFDRILAHHCLNPEGIKVES